MVTVLCKKCSGAFYAKPSWIKNGYGIYCSKACQHQAARTGREVTCHTCSSLVYKSPKALTGSKSGKFFCSKTCQTKWRNTFFSGKKHPNYKSGTSNYRTILEKSSTIQACTLCKTTDSRVLAAHHIDKNRKNNTIDNLAWLCHNCHHLVHHHKDEYKRFMAAIV